MVSNRDRFLVSVRILPVRNPKGIHTDIALSLSLELPPVSVLTDSPILSLPI